MYQKGDVVYRSEFGDEIRFLEEVNGDIFGYFVSNETKRESEPMLVEQIIMFAGDGNVAWDFIEPTKS
jgi:hypothetical protein